MGEIRYYTDEHVSKAIIRGLRQRGVDVLTVPEANRLGAADKPHSGIVFAHQNTATGEIIRGLMLIHQVLQAEDMLGNIEFL